MIFRSEFEIFNSCEFCIFGFEPFIKIFKLLNDFIQIKANVKVNFFVKLA